MANTLFFPAALSPQGKTLVAWAGEGAPTAVTLAAKDLLARSIPTPYAQAEMMARVLRETPKDPAAPPPLFDATEAMPQTWERWRLLVLALVQGLLGVDTLPLMPTGKESRFGHMLTQVREDQRHVTRLRRTAALGAVGRETLGALDPECLLWVAPRMSPAEWGDLQKAVEHPDVGGVSLREALALLAEWRGMLARGQLWTTDESAPPWMRAIEYLLGHEKTPARDTTELFDEHCELVGPALLQMPGDRRLCVYLPTWHKDRRQQMARLFGLQPVAPREGAMVALSSYVELELADGSRAAPVARVKISAGIPNLPTATQPGSEGAGGQVRAQDTLLEGLGKLEILRPEIEWRDRVTPGVRLHDRRGSQGSYEDKVLAHLRAAVLQAHQNNPARPEQLRFEEALVNDVPTLFPDTVRFAVRMLHPRRGYLVAQLVGAEAVRKRRGVIPNDGINLLTLDPFADLPEEDPEFMIAIPGAPPATALAEWLTSEDGRRLDVGHLRALGFALWCFFRGEANVRDGVNWEAAPSKVSKRLLTPGTTTTPLRFEATLLSAVESGVADVGWSAKEDVWRRRATLQRFLRTARQHAARAQSGHVGSALAAVAMLRFVAWVRAGRGMGEFGIAGEVPKTGDLREVELVPGCLLPLARDYYRPGGSRNV